MISDLLPSLARAELYLALGTIFRRFDTELFQTSREDVDIEQDHFVPRPKVESQGIKILVK